MKKIFNLLLVFALVLVGGMLGFGKVNAANDFDIDYDVYGNQVIFTWDEVDGADHYDVYQEPIGGEDEEEISENGYILLDDRETPYYHTTDEFEPYTTYTVHIQAVTANHEQILAESEVTFDTEGSLDIDAYVRGTNVELEWFDLGNVKNYTIYRTPAYDEDTNEEYIVVDTTKDTEYVVTDLNEYEEYTFKVEAELKDGTIINYEPETVTTKDSFNLNVFNAYNGDIELWWDEIPGATKYEVYRYAISGIDQADDDILLATVPNDEGGEYTFEDVNPNVEYTFYIAAYDENGIISYSNDESVIASDEIHGFKTELKDNQINLSWKKYSDNAEYSVYYAEETGNEESFSDLDFKLAGTTKNTNYTITQLKPNKSYYFYVTTEVDGMNVSSVPTIEETGMFTLTDKNTSVTGITNRTYNGKNQTQNIVVKYNGATLKAGTDFTVNYNNHKNAGTAVLTIVGKNGYTGAVTKTFKINKAKNPMTVKAVNKKVKAKKVKKKKQVITPITASKAQGTVTYTKVSGNKKIKIDSKTGKITVKKKTKKGTYYVKVKVSAAGNKNYSAATKTVTIKITIK